MKRIYLSPPHMGGEELRFVQEAFESNWVAPAGPHLDAFEREFCQAVGIAHAVALSSGTAALHLALQLAGVGPGDEVFCSDLTFVASASPIVYLGARPVFVDSDRNTWNMDPDLVSEAMSQKTRKGKLPKALILVHLYGQSADVDPILQCCREYGVALIEDAAEVLGAAYKGRSAGASGLFGAFSFNGNKIITTSGGGMLVSADEGLINKARFLANQAREPVVHFEHRVLGYNYRLSNVLAGIGRGQLRVLRDRVEARRRIFASYREYLEDLPGIEFMPEAGYGRSTRWLTCLTVDPKAFGCDREAVRQALEEENIEARPVWKPMHLQPVFSGIECVGGAVSEDLFGKGLCLPSGTGMSTEDLGRVVGVVRRCCASL